MELPYPWTLLREPITMRCSKEYVIEERNVRTDAEFAVSRILSLCFDLRQFPLTNSQRGFADSARPRFFRSADHQSQGILFPQDTAGSTFAKEVPRVNQDPCRLGP